MIIILRFLEKDGFVQKHFLGYVNVFKLKKINHSHIASTSLDNQNDQE